MRFLKQALKYLVAAILAYTGMTAAYAYDEKVTGGTTGNYVGFQMGETNVSSADMELPNYDNQIVLVRPSNKGYGFRVYWGYQFTNYVAFEGGYGYYSPSTYNIPNGNQPEFKMGVVDLMGKGIAPLFWGFSVFVKGGAALVYYKQAGLLAPLPPNVNGTPGSDSITIRPEVGLGASYAFTPNWSVDLTATRITKGGVVPNSDMYTIGISYHAVDLYCGQFLC